MCASGKAEAQAFRNGQSALASMLSTGQAPESPVTVMSVTGA